MVVVTQVAKHVSDPGNQHNNDPRQEHILNKPSALCLAIGKQKSDWGGGGGEGEGGTDEPNRPLNFIKGVNIFFFETGFSFFGI